MTNCSQCGKNNCSHVIVKSSSPSITINIPYILTKQGSREFGSGSIASEDLLKIADIPALDFSMDFDVFCEYTDVSVKRLSNTGLKPEQWQRQTNFKRVGETSKWLSESENSSMPDGILIGERIPNNSYVNSKAHTTIGNFEIYDLSITNYLIDKCEFCGPFKDDDDNQIFQNRCDNHSCKNHNYTTSPFTIIDGQHRSMSLFNSALEKKEMCVSILLQKNKAENSIGYSLSDQAKIFTQVNTESEELDKIHKTWLKRFFGDWADVPTNSSVAFDLLALLGTNIPGVTNNWSSFIKMHPGSGKHRIDSNRATDAPSNALGGFSSMESIVNELKLAASTSGRDPFQIMIDWLHASVMCYPTLFNLPSSEGFLDENRPFEAYLRIFPRVLENVKMNPGFSGTFSYDDFMWSFNQHFDAFSVLDWTKYKSSGETPWMEFFNILKLMWPIPTSVLLPNRPTWFTVYTGGSTNCPDWIAYINIHPDPVEDFSLRTFSESDSIVIPGDNLSSTNSRAQFLPYDSVTWLRPRNVASGPRISYRIYDAYGQPSLWLNHPSGIVAEPVTSENRYTMFELSKAKLLENEMASRTGIKWDLRIIYQNQVGETSLVCGFTT